MEYLIKTRDSEKNDLFLTNELKWTNDVNDPKIIFRGTNNVRKVRQYVEDNNRSAYPIKIVDASDYFKTLLTKNYTTK